MWSGLEPVEGTYDQEYLDVLRKIIRLAWLVWDGFEAMKSFARNFAAHGVSVILDLHQVAVCSDVQMLKCSNVKCQ